MKPAGSITINFIRYLSNTIHGYKCRYNRNPFNTAEISVAAALGAPVLATLNGLINVCFFSGSHGQRVSEKRLLFFSRKGGLNNPGEKSSKKTFLENPKKFFLLFGENEK